jgi:mannosylglycerate hydrolase
MNKSERPKQARRVAVVPHAHWDREWYLPYQRFRLRLVELLDELLPRLEADWSYAHFLLDGQMAVVDDHCALRPHHASVIRRLVSAGRLSIGPWYTLPDEFLVSGETLVRNLQLGLARAVPFGGAMNVGYLPDMFGHVAQMPQILRHLGFDHAVVWRGVPSAIDRTAFWWTAPDGSTVRAEYLPTGYGNGANCPDDAHALLERIRRWETEHADMIRDGPILWMNGSDHAVPSVWLGRVVAEANDIAGSGYELRVVSLTDYLAAAPVDDLPRWTGELRSGARANVLMGVASNRTDVRLATARAERALERLAEPLSALFMAPMEWPAAELDAAWLHVIRNAAHDSVCACSVDEVCDAVLHRYAEATAIADGLVQRALHVVAGQAGLGVTLVVNPSARPRSGVVSYTVPGDETPPNTQLIERLPATEFLWDVRAADAPTVIGDVAAWYDCGYEVRPDGDDLEVVLRAGPVPANDAAALAEVADRTPDVPVRVYHARPRGVRVWAYVADVPGFGWSAVEPALMTPVTIDGTTMTNGALTVDVDAERGTFALNGHAGLGRLVDGGDAGDTYNWCPPDDDREIDVPEEVSVSVVEPGPVRASLRIDAIHLWPSRSSPARREEPWLPVTVSTTLTLDVGASFLAVAVALDNCCRDHRLRAWFPLPEPAAVSQADSAFAVVTRGLTAEGGPTELALATYPTGRFVSAGGLTIAPDRLLEYELVDVRDGQAHALALTLLRATRMLSRGPMSTRPLPAGPLIELTGSQVLGVHTFRYAIAAGAVDPHALADDATVPMLVATGRGASAGQVRHQSLQIEGAQVSSVRRTDGGQLEVRVFNPTAAPTTVGLGGRRGWSVDLRGRPLDPVDGAFTLEPWRIATIVTDR